MSEDFSYEDYLDYVDYQESIIENAILKSRKTVKILPKKANSHPLSESSISLPECS